MKVVPLLAAFALSVTSCSSPAEEVCAKAVECGSVGNLTEAECIEKIEHEFLMSEAQEGACDPVRAALEDYVS